MVKHKHTNYINTLIKILLVIAISIFAIGLLYVAGTIIYNDPQTPHAPGDLFTSSLVIILITLPLFVIRYSLKKLDFHGISFNTSHILIISILMIIIASIGEFGRTYNYFVRQNEIIEKSYSDIDIHYQKRFNLIPNLAKTAKAFSDFEQDIIVQITNARRVYSEGKTVDEKVRAANSFDSYLRNFLLYVENYPNLKSDALYLQLIQSLIQNEDEIATVKKEYNNEVKIYNQYANSFPYVLITGIIGVREKEYLKSELGKEIYNTKSLLESLK